MSELGLVMLFVCSVAGAWLLGYSVAMNQYWMPKYRKGMDDAQRIHDDIYGSHRAADRTSSEQK